MKEEELIKKLENAELPEIELQSHQRRLRMALLAAGYLQRRPRVTILDLAKSKMKGGIDIIMRGLVSRQPVWKTAVIGVLALALITGLTIALPSLTGQSAEALATDIVQNSPEVRTALGGGEVTVVKVIKVVDDKGTVICRGEIGLLTAEVDLKTKEVTEWEVVPMPQLTEEEKEAAINIARADPRVQEILDQGAFIHNVHPMYSFGAKVNLETGETEEFSETLAVVVLASDLNGWESWFVHVDLAGKKVIRIINPKEFEELSPSSDEYEIEYFHILEGPVEEPVFRIGKGGIEKGTQ